MFFKLYKYEMNFKSIDNSSYWMSGLEAFVREHGIC